MSPTLQTSVPGGGLIGNQRPPRFEQLEATLLRAEQQRDDVDVLMGARPYAGRAFPQRRIVDHPQHAVALAHLVVEPVRLELQEGGDRLEQLATHAIEGLPQLERDAPEGGIALDPDVVRHRGR
jgi:hypothetical protein